MDANDIVGDIASMVLLAAPVAVAVWCIWEIWREIRR